MLYAIPVVLIVVLVFGILAISKSGQEPPHEYVDMGLPSGTKWATTNVGATTPEDYGDFFSWGEIEPKGEYSTGVAYGENFGEISGDETKDAATANWGNEWRMPSKDEFEELLNSCDTDWTTQNGVEGLRFTSRANGNSIFLSAGGYKFFDRWGLNGRAGKNLNYWSSTQKDGGQAYSLNAEQKAKMDSRLSGDHIPYGRLVRPVKR